MLTMLRAALVTTALLGSGALASGADFCLVDSFNNMVVGKGFSLPSKGVCKEFRGFVQGSDVSFFGQACGSSDNTRITFRLTTMGTNQIGGYLFALDRGSLSGSGQFCQAQVVGGGGCAEMTSIARTACSPSTVPVP
jgi:hypothetical protein